MRERGAKMIMVLIVFSLSTIDINKICSFRPSDKNFRRNQIRPLDKTFRRYQIRRYGANKFGVMTYPSLNSENIFQVFSLFLQIIS